MLYINLKFRSILQTGLLIISSNFVFAQTQPITRSSNSSSSSLTIALAIIALVLCFVIWGLGQSLLAIAKLLRDKQKKIIPVLLLFIILWVSQGNVFGQMVPVGSSPNTAAMNGINDDAFWVLMWVIGAEFFIIFMLTLGIRRLYAELLDEKKSNVGFLDSFKLYWRHLDAKLFTRATPIEKEADILLDHDYDGIRELDNALPPWWKYGFYVTIVIGFIYLFNFHVMGTGKNPDEEYFAEMEKARIEKAEYEAKNKDKIDETNVPMSDAIGISVGNELFHQPGMCASCHGQLGEGGAGPNLTDDYWIHKGSLNDIYQSIKLGYPDKGMQSWQASFTPKQISQLTSYIKFIRGTNPPNALPPKGELYIDNTIREKSALVDSSKMNNAIK